MKASVLLFLLLLLLIPDASASIVGNWTFNNGSGTWANDTSGFNNNGTIVGGTFTTDSASGTAYHQNGTTGVYTTVPTSASLNLTGAFTFGVWVKINTITGVQNIFSKMTFPTSGYRFQISSGVPRLFTHNGSGAAYDVLSELPLEANKWYYIQGMVNGGTGYIWTNGVLTKEQTGIPYAIASPAAMVFGDFAASGGEVLNGTIDELKIYNHALTGIERTADYQQYQPVLTYPTGGLNISAPYPPLATTVNLSWHDTKYSADRLLIAKDSNFNIISVDIHTSNDYYSATLESDRKYYWKVSPYYIETNTYGPFTPAQNFNLVMDYNPFGSTGIVGIVYSLIDGTQTPLSDATVYIRKETLNWSDSAVTGSNGYYQFDNLTNNTVYSISAKAVGYEDSVTEYVTTIPGQRITKNIQLNKCISGFNCFYNQHYVQFTVQNIWFSKYSGVTATVYKGSELTASDTQTTGTDGTVNFLLIKDQQYRITFINATAGISVTWTGYPSQTQYYIITDATTSGWDTHGTDAGTTTQISVTTQTINDTHAYVNMSYNDTLAGTSNLRFYLNKSIAGDPNNQTNLQSINGGNADQYNASFIVSGYGGNSYIVRVKADHSTYGTISYSYAVHFAQLPGPLANFDATIILMLFVGLVLFVGGMFGQTSQVQGMAIVCGLAWILAGIGIFSNVNAGAGFYLALSLATIISIIANINERGRHEALQ